MKKIKLLLIFGVLFFVFLFQSCEKEKEHLESSVNQNPSQSFLDFGQILIQDINTKGFLYKSMISNYKKNMVEEFLVFDLLSESNSTNLRNSESIIENIITANPILTVAYPSFAFREESFEDHLSEIDFVVLLDDEAKGGFYRGIDMNGRRVSISTQFDESINYAVIKYDETLEPVNPTNLKSYFGGTKFSELLNFTPERVVGDYHLYNSADILNSIYMHEGILIEGEVPSTPRGDDDCDRDEQRKDELHRVKFDNKKVVKYFESGFHLPRVELIATYALFNVSTESVNLVTKRIRKKWKDMTYDYSSPLQLEIATWDKEELGNRWQVIFVERDFEKVTEESFTFGFSVGIKKKEGLNTNVSVEWKITKNKKDKLIGSSLIEYCDPALGEGDEYKLADVEGGGFWIREHIRD